MRVKRVTLHLPRKKLVKGGIPYSCLNCGRTYRALREDPGYRCPHCNDPDLRAAERAAIAPLQEGQ